MKEAKNLNPFVEDLILQSQFNAVAVYISDIADVEYLIGGKTEIYISDEGTQLIAITELPGEYGYLDIKQTFDLQGNLISNDK